MTVPGVAWVLSYTIAAEIGDIHRFSSPAKLTEDVPDGVEFWWRSGCDVTTRRRR
jgi:hypothetical protein